MYCFWDICQPCSSARKRLQKDVMQDVARLVMLGAELGQMPAWYVELSYALALEQCALPHYQPKSPALAALEAGVAPHCPSQCAS